MQLGFIKILSSSIPLLAEDFAEVMDMCQLS